ncbi:hypothetical protein J2Y69_002215 [Microbacterium resistens]|uniref:LppX_LprAFG lipoprotein n=1 Tax=Microbacterium resistens TaxID=156977 RepID=A0ABU1SDD6_9MICO|nr:hypothetical protein [Microbacterium resistens]MDR6867611.1 hypothetical protein [Microbacterium resistens]
MRTHWSRAVAAVTIALAAGAGVTACTAGTDTTAGNKSSQAPAATPTPTPTSSQATVIPLPDGFLDRIATATRKAGSVHFTQSTGIEGQSISSTGDLVLDEDPNVVRLALITQMPGGATMEMRIVDGVTYANMGEATQNLFARVDGTNSSATLGVSADQVNVATQVESFSAALVGFSSQEGAETIDGVVTTQYTLTLDTAKLLASQGVTDLPDVSAIGETVAYEMFVGPDDLPRRMTMNLANMPIQMDYTRWGEPVEISAPSAEQMTDAVLGG